MFYTVAYFGEISSNSYFKLCEKLLKTMQTQHFVETRSGSQILFQNLT